MHRARVHRDVDRVAALHAGAGAEPPDQRRLRVAFRGCLDGSLGPDVAGERLFFYMYFVMTGAHAVHLIVGLALVAAMIVKVARNENPDHSCGAVELTGLYWHLVDIVWIFLYPMLYLVSRT